MGIHIGPKAREVFELAIGRKIPEGELLVTAHGSIAVQNGEQVTIIVHNSEREKIRRVIELLDGILPRWAHPLYYDALDKYLWEMLGDDRSGTSRLKVQTLVCGGGDRELHEDPEWDCNRDAMIRSLRIALETDGVPLRYQIEDYLEVLLDDLLGRGRCAVPLGTIG